MENKRKISAYIITFNEEENVEEALKSLHFVDEIIVVDSGSDDKTLEIVRQYTDKIFVNEWAGFSNQRNFALDKCENDWVIPLDADEVITPESALKIMELLNSEPEFCWYKIRRIEHFNRVPMKYGADIPSEQIRLFRKSMGRYEGDVHEYPRLPGEYGLINEPILHYSIKSLADMVSKRKKYSLLGAKQKFENGERHGFFYKYFSGLAMFLKSYFFRKGCLDGLYGFYRSYGDGLEFYYRQKYLWDIWNKR